MCKLYCYVCFVFMLFVFVFFFKQKTAYEMRISDWSSDVCSSDLFCPAPAAKQPGSQYQRLYRRSPRVPERETWFTCENRRASSPGSVEIGRASCRERVCQYV